MWLSHARLRILVSKPNVSLEVSKSTCFLEVLFWRMSYLKSKYLVRILVLKPKCLIWSLFQSQFVFRSLVFKSSVLFEVFVELKIAYSKSCCEVKRSFFNSHSKSCFEDKLSSFIYYHFLKVPLFLMNVFMSKAF